MTHNERSSFIVSASTGVAIAGAILSAAIILGGPAAAQSPTLEMPQLIYSPWAKFCGRGSLGGREVCFTGKDARTKDGQTFMAATPAMIDVIVNEAPPRLTDCLLDRIELLRQIKTASPLVEHGNDATYMSFRAFEPLDDIGMGCVHVVL
jgi:hypothetical protein